MLYIQALEKYNLFQFLGMTVPLVFFSYFFLRLSPSVKFELEEEMIEIKSIYHPYSYVLSHSSRAINMTHEDISIPEDLPSYNEEICSYEAE